MGALQIETSDLVYVLPMASPSLPIKNHPCGQSLRFVAITAEHRLSVDDPPDHRRCTGCSS